MIEMNLTPSKETDNKLRWSTYITKDETEFEVYIPKWRVPTPWPSIIHIQIIKLDDMPSVSEIGVKPLLTDRIYAYVHRYREHTRTIRFYHYWDSSYDPKMPAIGDLYIPYSLLPPSSEWLLIIVKWDLSSMGKF